MTRDGEAELGARVTLKGIPAATQGRERQSLPTAEGHRAVFITAYHKYAHSAIWRKMLKCHHPVGHPEVGLCPHCQETGPHTSRHQASRGQSSQRLI